MQQHDDSAGRFHDYATGGQLVLWATRHWLSAYSRGRMVRPCVWQSFAVAGLEAAYSHLCRLLRIVVFRELPVTSVATPSSPVLKHAEFRFMSVLSVLEKEGPCAARAALGPSVAPAVARELVVIAGDLIAVLQQRGHRISASRDACSEDVRYGEPRKSAAYVH